MSKLINLLANLANASDRGALSGSAGTASARATVISVDDPKNRGRVLVVFDDMAGQDVPQVVGSSEEYSGPRIEERGDHSHWIDVCPAFKGKQPKGLVGKRVTIMSTNGDYTYAILGDVLYDPGNLTKEAKKNLKLPNNSSMTRLPCYESGQLPPATKENVGCVVVECGGPLQSDWLCVCLQRNGSYYWVRHIDASHGHAGQNDSSERPDSDGDSMAPINNMTVWDYTFPTTAGEMNKQSSYGTSPRGNPFGGQAKWIGPAKGEK